MYIVLITFKLHTPGSSTQVYTIIGFTVDHSDQIMVIFTSDTLSSPIAELKIYQDYLTNIADKEGNQSTKLLNDISVELQDAEAFEDAHRKSCNILVMKRKAGEIW